MGLANFWLGTIGVSCWWIVWYLIKIHDLLAAQPPQPQSSEVKS